MPWRPPLCCRSQGWIYGAAGSSSRRERPIRHGLWGGSSLTSAAPPIVTVAVAGVTMVMAVFVPRRTAGLWIGLLTIIGAPSLRMYGVLFAVPAMLRIRRELALIAATLIATYTNEGLWLGLGVVVVANLAAPVLPWLREPTSGATAGELAPGSGA